MNTNGFIKAHIGLFINIYTYKNNDQIKWKTFKSGCKELLLHNFNLGEYVVFENSMKPLFLTY